MDQAELLRIGAVPLYQNKMYATPEAARGCPRGDVALVQDARSGLVHNAAFAPRLLQYDASYQNEQGHSDAFRGHLAQALAVVGRHFAGASVLEIGCGKGRFVELMRGHGLAARGMDAAYEGDADYIEAAHFGRGAGARAAAIVMRHVLEHIPAPYAFLREVAEANDGGLIYVEVPCLDWIFAQRAWFDVFYEHVNYFRQSDFARMFGRVLEAGTAFGGQYLYVVADLASLRDPGDAALPAPTPAVVPPDFFASLDRCAGLARAGGGNGVWGAAAKGVMFAHHLQARGASLALAIDINPAKQGAFLAGSGLPVLAPAEGLRQLGAKPRLFVMNSNYLPEIRAQAGADPDYIAVDRP
jgi:hypothetical protein